MTDCHLCGRAMIYDPTDNPCTSHIIPICSRANCEPERNVHAYFASQTHDTFWKLRTRLEWEGKA